MGERVTLNDVAARAGVSRASASLALRGDGRLSDETRQRVLRVMDELGYVYNRAAAALREKTRRLVGVVLTNVDNPFFAQSLQAIEAELDRLGYSAIIASSLRSVSRQEQVLQSMREFGVAGVILAAVEDTVLQTVTELERAGIACLSYTRYDPAVDYVGPDDVAGGRAAARHLLGHGASRIAFVGSRTPSSASDLRRTGIEQELADAHPGLGLRIVNTEVSPAGGYEAGRLLMRDGAPEAIVCMSDAVALGVIRAFSESDAPAMPRIVGFDDIDFAAFSTPSLTTVSSRPVHTGREAAALFVDRLEGRRTAPEIHFTEPRLVIRESCGCHPAGSTP